MMNAMGSNRFTQGWTRRSSLGAVLVAASAGLALLAGSSPALAGTSNLTVDVHSVVTPVSPSASTCTFPTLVKGCATTAYSVGFSNLTSSNVSNAWFHATTYVFDNNGALTSIKAQFLTAPPNCSISADSTTISCNIGNVQSGATIPAFVATVHSPSVTAVNYTIGVAWDVPTGQRCGRSPFTGELVDGPHYKSPGDHQIGDPPTPSMTTRSWVTGATIYLPVIPISRHPEPRSRDRQDTEGAGYSDNAGVARHAVTDNICFRAASSSRSMSGTFKDPAETTLFASYLRATLRRDATTVRPSAKGFQTRM
jgi:hypothetical protein